MNGLLLATLWAATLTGTQDNTGFEALPGGMVWAEGKLWPSLQDWHDSPRFRQRGRACGTTLTDEQRRFGERRGSTCSSTHTDPTNPHYPDSGDYQIKLVFHVICADDNSDITNCSGYLSLATIQQQLSVLNGDFAGDSNGAAHDTRIQFTLEGVSWVKNTFWYGDSDSARDEFFQRLNVDKERYTNIYINSGGNGGLLGQATLPYGVAGSWNDFVMIANDTVPGSGGSFGLGRTLVHEIGHNYGLYHTFGGPNDSDSSTCPTGDCNASGDLICDTDPEQDASSGCTQRNTCSDPDPIHNFMNYTHDSCMTIFTAEQGTRMRCTLQTYREHLIDGSAGTAIGACCVSYGCYIAHQSDCQTYGGTWQGAGTSCENVTCDGGGSDPTGACCQGINCASDTTASECESYNGTWQGAGTTCGGVTCDGGNDPTGACCQGVNCAPDTTASECESYNGTWQGAGTTCGDVTCESADPVGACCNGSNCTPDMTEADCTYDNSDWQGEGSTCGSNPCLTVDGDTCDAAIIVSAGSTEFNTTGYSMSDMTMDPSQCGGSASDIDGPDIFFSWSPGSSGSATIDTCDLSSFDTSLVVYSGTDCDMLHQEACDGDTADEWDGCQEYASTLDLEVELNTNYIIRVGGWGVTDWGAGTLNIDFDTDCIGDLNQNGVVSRIDVLLLLQDWGQEGSSSDLDGDGTVTMLDLIYQLTHWGVCG
ncbi:MAG: M12 family metallo-peptidase [Phycisphaerales bacterium]|nr:M12 family metallo-peptidase [Phycisphaerales bacterium]